MHKVASNDWLAQAVISFVVRTLHPPAICVERQRNLEKFMRILERALMERIAGGEEADSASCSLVDGSGGWNGGSGGWDVYSLGVPYDPLAVGIEGGADAIVKISGSLGGNGEFLGPAAPQLSTYNVPVWVEVQPVSEEHDFFDKGLAGIVGKVSGGVATSFVEAALVGAEVGAVATPIGAVVGLAVGLGVAAASYYLLQSDHGKSHWELVEKSDL